MKKRTKIIILAGMVVLLGVTGFLNLKLNNNVETAGTQAVTSANYFITYREDRQTTRDQEFLYYEAILNSANTTAEDKVNAQAKINNLAEIMEQERYMEELIKAKGFEDAVVTNSTNNVNVIVKSSELSSSEVAQIVSVVQDSTNKDIDNIKIIPVE